jgi:hypothetical protein
LYALQIADDEQIPYAAAVIMEIYKNEDGQFYVEVSSASILHRLKIFSFITATIAS